MEVEDNTTEITEVQEATQEVIEVSAEEQLAALQTELQQLKEQSAQSDEALIAVVEAKKADIDQSILELMPEGMSSTEAIQWLEKASVISTTAEDVEIEPITSIGRATPVSIAEPIEKVTEGLTPMQKMTVGLEKAWGKR